MTLVLSNFALASDALNTLVNQQAPPGTHQQQLTPTITQTFVALETRPGVISHILLLEPESPKASVVLFAGGEGRIIINEDGTIERGDNFLVRSRQLFAENGMRVAVFDAPSDHWHLMNQRTTSWHARDIAAVMSYLRQMSDIPVWLVGTSRGTISAASAAVQLKENGPEGIVLVASVFSTNQNGSLYDVKLGSIEVPTLFVHHKLDGCWVAPYNSAPMVVRHMKKSTRVELFTFTGGESGADECGPISHHGFLGIEADVVRSITTWIQEGEE